MSKTMKYHLWNYVVNKKKQVLNKRHFRFFRVASVYLDDRLTHYVRHLNQLLEVVP